MKMDATPPRPNILTSHINHIETIYKKKPDTTAKTPFQATAETPFQTQPKTPFQTQPKTPFQTQPKTPFQTQPKTPFQTQPKTPFQTQQKTLGSHYKTCTRTVSKSKSAFVSRLASVYSVNKNAKQNVQEDANKVNEVNNKTNYNQISRAHSEAGIKYQIQVNDKTYKILRKIGSGGSAKVYEGFDPTTAQTVAIKIINIANADHRTQNSYFNEKNLLNQLKNSKHVVKLYDSEYKVELKELVIVMEKGDGDLSQVIDSYFKERNGSIDGIFIKFYWRGMVQAVNDIHQHGIVHADLKPVNFILVKNQIKLIDFGIADEVSQNATSIVKNYQIGTINYMAPEALRNCAGDASFQHLPLLSNEDNNVDIENNHRHTKTKIKYNTKVDIWSLGCILYYLVYGRPPFDKYKDTFAKIQAITNPNHQISFPEISNRNLLCCLKMCLKYRPEERPTALDLLNSTYLKEDIVII